MRSHRPIPLIAYWADIRTDRIRTPAKGELVRGCVIAPANAEVARLAILDPNEPATAGPPLRGHVSARNRSWMFARRGTIQG